MRGLAVLGLLVGLPWGLAARAGDDIKIPETGPERAVLRTVAGDIVLAFYPKVAPKNVSAVLAMMRQGVYNTTHFFRIEPNFVIQLSNAQDRLTPMRTEQSAMIKKLPLEVSPDVKHHPWTLSMARMDGDPNTAETSFSILLNDSPHLDGQYTVIGHVERGFEVVQEMLKVSRDTNHRPAARLTVSSVDVFETAADLAKTTVAGPIPVKDPGATPEGKVLSLRLALAAGLLVIILLSVGSFFLYGRLTPRMQASSHLLVVLIAVFLAVIVLQPLAAHSTVLGAALFVAFVATFKLLGRFESPV